MLKNENFTLSNQVNGYRSQYFSANVNAYYTMWKDKALYDTGSYEDVNGLLSVGQ